MRQLFCKLLSVLDLMLRIQLQTQIDKGTKCKNEFNEFCVLCDTTYLTGFEACIHMLTQLGKGCFSYVGNVVSSFWEKKEGRSPSRHPALILRHQKSSTAVHLSAVILHAYRLGTKYSKISIIILFLFFLHFYFPNCTLGYDSPLSKVEESNNFFCSLYECSPFLSPPQVQYNFLKGFETNKMKDTNYHTIRTVPKSNQKIINTHIHGHSLS